MEHHPLDSYTRLSRERCTMTAKRHTTKKQADLIAAGILLILGIYVSIEVSGFKKIASLDIGPAFFPKVLGGLLIVFSILLALQTVKNNNQEPVEFMNRNLWIVFIVVGIFSIVFNLIGFVFSSIMILMVLMKLMGAGTWKKTLFVSTITTLIIYGVFDYFLHVPLPWGIFEGLF